mmetsp:Transcript_72263/g.197876  ORF Transcript_72263/g.197876 Transcript_72263/m.197876 type:complete len:249 (-) Transcript_72263:854-1600(-)
MRSAVVKRSMPKSHWRSALISTPSGSVKRSGVDSDVRPMAGLPNDDVRRSSCFTSFEPIRRTAGSAVGAAEPLAPPPLANHVASDATAAGKLAASPQPNSKVVYEKPCPKGKATRWPWSARQPTASPSPYLHVGVPPTHGATMSPSLIGNVTGSFADGLTAPSNTSAAATPVCSPARKKASAALTLAPQSATNAPGASATTASGGAAGSAASPAVSAWIQSCWSRRRVGRSLDSVVVPPAHATSTLTL